MAKDINIQDIYTDTYKYLQKKFENTALNAQKELLDELAPYIQDSVRRETAKALLMLGLDPKNRKDKEYIQRLNNLGKKKSSFNSSLLKKYGKWIAGLLVVGAAGYGVKKGVDTYFKDEPDVKKKKEIIIDSTNIINQVREDTSVTLSDFSNKGEKKIQKPESIDKSILEDLSKTEIEAFVEDLISDYPLEKDTRKKVIERVIQSLSTLKVYGYQTPGVFFMYVINPETNKEVLLSYYDDMDTTFKLLSEVTGETFLSVPEEEQEANTTEEEATETEEAHTEEEATEKQEIITSGMTLIKPFEMPPEESEGGVDMSVEIFKFQGQILTEDERNILMHQLVRKEDYSKLVGKNAMPSILNIPAISISKEGNTYFIFYKDVSNGINIPLGEWTFEKLKEELTKQFGEFEKEEGNILHKNNKDDSGTDNDILKSFGIPLSTSLDLSKVKTLSELKFNENITDQKRDKFLIYQYFLNRQLKGIVESFQKYEEKYAQKENFKQFKQEVQKEIDDIIGRHSELQREAKENSTSFSFNPQGDGYELGKGAVSMVDSKVHLLSFDEEQNEFSKNARKLMDDYDEARSNE